MRRTSVALAVACSATLSACQKPLFPEDAPRTQYQRFDELRGRGVPTDRSDSRGGSDPALRERLGDLGR